MSKIQVDAIEQQTACGTTLTAGGGAGKTVVVDATTVTLGRCGGTVALASGATQTGFGRTGTVNWDTTPKTATFTGVNGNGYFVNTTGGVVTVNLPASPAAGNIVSVKDYNGNFSTNNCTVGRNGSNIRGETSDFLFELDNSGAAFIYVDSTEGWQVFVDGSDGDRTNPFIVATGGTITTSGNFKIHTFTGPGSFVVAATADEAGNNEVSYLAVAGGGAGGFCGGGGGGAGGYRERKSAIDTYTASPKNGATPITVTATSFPIAVGGAGAAEPNNGGSGSNSVFSSITSAGGGGGGVFTGGACHGPTQAAITGGSGGGSGGVGGATVIAGAAGNTPPVSPSQGNAGGSGQHNGGSAMASGGGGGAIGAGSAGSSNTPGPGSGIGGTGGVGTTTSITGTPTAYAGGGGGAGFGTPGGSAASPCGTGGTGGVNSSTATVAGTTNRGGGGGGGAHSGGGPNGSSAGGSGIVVIRYKFQ